MNARIEKFTEITSEEKAHETLMNICSHVANGGSTIDLCQMWGVRYSDVALWLCADDDRKKLYNDALNAQLEWTIKRIFDQLRTLAFFDIKDILNDDGTIRPVPDWPESVSRAICGLEIFEESAGFGENKTFLGYTKKMKTESKLKALELMMKSFNLLTERTMSLHGSSDDDEFRKEFFGLTKKKPEQEPAPNANLSGPKLPI